MVDIALGNTNAGTPPKADDDIIIDVDFTSAPPDLPPEAIAATYQDAEIQPVFMSETSGALPAPPSLESWWMIAAICAVLVSGLIGIGVGLAI